jgi:6-methylsalicylate decarboxylase
MEAKEYKKWDMHHHIVPEFYIKEMQKQGFGKLSSLVYPKWSPEISIKMMAEFNILKSIVSVSAPGVYFGDDNFSSIFARQCNEYIAKLIQDFPHQFGGFASVSLPDVESANKELEYAFDVLHLDGLILMTNVNDIYLGDKKYHEFYSELNRRQATVFIHPNLSLKREDHKLLNPLYWWQNDTAVTLVDFIRSGYHLEFPNIKFIPAHGGGVFSVLYPLIVEKLKEENPEVEKELEIWKSQLFLDTASKAYDEQLSVISHFSDASHIVFGSDFPWANKMAGKLIMDKISNLDKQEGLDNIQIQNIFMENAKKAIKKESVPVVNNNFKQVSHEVVIHSSKENVKLHYHCNPQEVIDLVSELKESIGLETIEPWNSAAAFDWADKNHFDILMLSLDIPELWDLKSYDRAKVLRKFNETVARICKENSTKLRAFGAIDIGHVTYALDEIDYCVNDLKMEGICLYTEINKSSFESFIDSRILEKISLLKTPVMIHPKNTRGIPLVNENYLDSVYFMVKAFYLGFFDEYLKNTNLILTHTGGVIPYVAQPFGILSYIQAKKPKMGEYLIDNFIHKKSKGYDILMNMVKD